MGSTECEIPKNVDVGMKHSTDPEVSRIEVGESKEEVFNHEEYRALGWCVVAALVNADRKSANSNFQQDSSRHNSHETMLCNRCPCHSFRISNCWIWPWNCTSFILGRIGHLYVF